MTEYMIIHSGTMVGGPYQSRDEALAQAFEKGAMPVNPGFGENNPFEPMYKESHMFNGWEIRKLKK